MKYFIAIWSVFLLLGTAAAHAEMTTLRQQILPIDCIYEVIDVGTQKLRYLTPETCPIDPGPPTITEPVIEQPITDTSQGVSVKPWYRLPFVPYQEASAQVGPDSQSKPPEKTPDVKGEERFLRDVILHNKDGVFLAIIAVAAWFAFIAYRRNTKRQ